MTVTNSQFSNTFIGDGFTTVFPFTVKSYEESWMLAKVDSIPTPINVSLYTLQDGGVAEFDVAPIGGSKIQIYREIPITQLVEFPDYGPFPARNNEDALDKLTLMFATVLTVDGGGDINGLFTFNNTLGIAKNVALLFDNPITDLGETGKFRFININDNTAEFKLQQSTTNPELWLDILIVKNGILTLPVGAETDFTPSNPRSLTNKNYVDERILRAGDSMLGNLNVVYPPIENSSAVSRKWVLEQLALAIGGLEFLGFYDASSGNLPADGTANGQFYEIVVDGTLNVSDGISAPQPTQLVQGEQIIWDNNNQWWVKVAGSGSGAGGQEWEMPLDNDPIIPAKGFFANAGETFIVPNTEETISFIVTDGSNSADSTNPIILDCSGTPNTFDDLTTTFEIDVAGASVEFALLDTVWQVVDFGRILNIVGNSEVTLFDGSAQLDDVLTLNQDPLEFDEIVITTELLNGGLADQLYYASSISDASRWVAASGSIATNSIDAVSKVANTANDASAALVQSNLFLSNRIGVEAGDNKKWLVNGSKSQSPWESPTIVKIVGKKQAKVYRDVELTDTANTWTEAQTINSNLGVLVNHQANTNYHGRYYGSASANWHDTAGGFLAGVNSSGEYYLSITDINGDYVSGGIKITRDGTIVNNADSDIKHNVASFIWNSASNTLTGAPAGWYVIKDNDADIHLVHDLGKLVYPQAIAWKDSTATFNVSVDTPYKGGGSLNASRFIITLSDNNSGAIVPVDLNIQVAW